MNFHLNKKKSKFLNWKIILYVFGIIIFLFGLILFNFYFKVRNINIEFFDQGPENIEIQKYVDELVRKEASSFYSFIFLDEDLLKKLIRDEFQVVGSVKVSKNYNLDMKIVISKNQEFFYTCLGEDSDFLVKCMLGNTDGEYYKEISELPDAIEKQNKINIEINPKVLYNLNTEQKLENPDSLSGTRIYTKEDFKILREILNWMKKNAFVVEKVYVNDLKIVEIKTEDYKIVFNLDKSFVESVKDFELISRVGNLQKYINEERENLDYIDLSYKNKVFYKLKNNTENVIMSTTSTSTIR